MLHLPVFKPKLQQLFSFKLKILSLKIWWHEFKERNDCNIIKSITLDLSQKTKKWSVIKTIMSLLLAFLLSLSDYQNLITMLDKKKTILVIILLSRVIYFFFFLSLPCNFFWYNMTRQIRLHRTFYPIFYILICHKISSRLLLIMASI